MKKPEKMLTGWGLCLLLNAAAAGTALAAGWTSEFGTWKYVNSNGSYAANEWKTSKEESYYLGDEDDGAMKTGWRCLAFDEDEVPEEGDISPAYSSAGEDVKWFYFQTNGKAKKAGDGDYATMTVDDEGFMAKSQWMQLSEHPGDLSLIHI